MASNMKEKQEVAMHGNNILSVLWTNIRGQLKKNMQEGGFSGIVTYLVSSVSSKVILATLGPWGSILVPVSDYLITSLSSALQETFTAWGTFDFHVTKSGLAVLENPKLLKSETRLLKLPDEIVLPSKDLIKPPRELLLNPTFPMRTSRESSGSNPVNRLSPSSRLQSRPELRSLRSQPGTPHESPFSLLAKQPGFESERFSGSKEFRSQYQPNPLRDIQYPQWALTGQRPSKSNLSTGVQQSISFSNLARSQKNLKEFIKRNQAAAVRSRKIHQDAMDRSRKSHSDFVKRSSEIAQRNRLNAQRRNLQNPWKK